MRPESNKAGTPAHLTYGFGLYEFSEVVVAKKRMTDTGMVQMFSREADKSPIVEHHFSGL